MQLQRRSTIEFRPDDKPLPGQRNSGGAAGDRSKATYPATDPRAILLKYDYDKNSPPFRLLTAAGALAIVLRSPLRPSLYVSSANCRPACYG